MKCKTCKAHCALVGKERDVNYKCLAGYVPITNADRIRQMSDEELAEMLKIGYALWCDSSCLDNRMKGTCKDCILEWLKKEVEECTKN